jgi:hypothetical protein
MYVRCLVFSASHAACALLATTRSFLVRHSLSHRQAALA